MMKTDRHNRKTYIILLLIIIICDCLMLLIFEGKKDFHMDEVWSYSLSNSHEKPFLFYWQIGTGEIGSETRTYKLKAGEENPFNIDRDNKFYEQWHSGEEFHNYLTVQEDERFDFANVYYNQTCDVHPPLYYLLLHTISSFFPDSFSKWYAASINLFFYSLSLLALFFLGRQMFKSDKKALLAVTVWGLSRAGLSDAVFLRMYMIMTFLTILLAYFHMQLIENYKIKYVALIFTINLLGFLTQYYFYIFSFFITASVCIYLLFKKKIKQLLIYACTVLAAVGAAILVFPAAVIHLTQGCYTDTTVNGLTSFLGGRYLLTYLLQDFTGLAYYDKTLLADLLPIIVLVFVIILWLRFCKKEADKKEKIIAVIGRIRAGNVILLISLIFSGILIGNISPNMQYFSDRYIFALYPIFVLPFVSVVCFLVKKLTSRFKIRKYCFQTAAAVLMALTVMSNTLNENRYFGISLNSPEVNDIISDAADGGTFYYIPDRERIIHLFAPFFINSDKVYPAHALDDSLIRIINENEIGAESAYLIFEAITSHENGEYVSENKKGIEFVLTNLLEHDFEFVADFYYGKNQGGDLYHMYRVNYT